MSTKKSADTSFRDLVARLNAMSNITPEEERAQLMEAAGKAPKVLDDKDISLADIAKLAGIKEYVEPTPVSEKAEKLVESIVAEPKAESVITKAIKESDADESLATSIKKEVNEEVNRLDKIAELEAQLAELKSEQKEEQTSVKKMNKYQGGLAQPGSMFSTLRSHKTIMILKKGTDEERPVEKQVSAPASVKAAIRYNDLLRFWKLDTKHELITNGTKIKWIYLKNNPYQIEEIAFLDYDMPEKIHTFIEQYADRKKVFETILLNKLEGFYSDLEWNLNLNPYINQFFEL